MSYRLSYSMSQDLRFLLPVLAEQGRIAPAEFIVFSIEFSLNQMINSERESSRAAFSVIRALATIASTACQGHKVPKPFIEVSAWRTRHALASVLGEVVTGADAEDLGALLFIGGLL